MLLFADFVGQISSDKIYIDLNQNINQKLTFLRVATSWKSPGFFLLSWKVLEVCLYVLESP